MSIAAGSWHQYRTSAMPEKNANARLTVRLRGRSDSGSNTRIETLQIQSERFISRLWPTFENCTGAHPTRLFISISTPPATQLCSIHIHCFETFAEITPCTSLQTFRPIPAVLCPKIKKIKTREYPALTLCYTPSDGAQMNRHAKIHIKVYATCPHNYCLLYTSRSVMNNLSKYHH